MSDLSKSLGVESTFTHGEATYSLSPLRVEHLAMFSAWLEDEAWKKVERLAGKVPEPVYQGRLDAVARLVTGNAFDFGKPLFDEADRSEAGLRHMLYLRLSHNPGMTPALANEILDADHRGIMARLAALDAGPNGSTPEEAPPG